MKNNHMKDNKNAKFIDVRKIIRDKNPRLLKIIPWFIINYLKRIIHEDEINEFIESKKQYKGIEFAEAIIELFKLKVIVSGIENIPANGRYVITANHPLGGLDGIALITSVAKIRKDVVFPVNDILMNIENLKELFIPINKHGSNADNIKIFDDTFASDKTILFFPAGLVSRKQKKGVIKDLEWKKTIISRARKSNRDIIPAYIEARNTNFFYNLANFRKKIGLKQNIEMLYLPDEMYKQKNKTLEITFGQPISIATFDRTKENDKFWAEHLKNVVYSIKNQAESC